MFHGGGRSRGSADRASPCARLRGSPNTLNLALNTPTNGVGTHTGVNDDTNVLLFLAVNKMSRTSQKCWCVFGASLPGSGHCSTLPHQRPAYHSLRYAAFAALCFCYRARSDSFGLNEVWLLEHPTKAGEMWTFKSSLVLAGGEATWSPRLG